MEVVVNDTNILIDLFNAGLLPYCRELNLEFRTLDVVINEIEDSEQHTTVLTEKAVISDDEMTVALERLLATNNRLPKKLIKERIEVLKRQ